jgi:hypothetical protein
MKYHGINHLIELIFQKLENGFTSQIWHFFFFAIKSLIWLFSRLSQRQTHLAHSLCGVTDVSREVRLEIYFTSKVRKCFHIEIRFFLNFKILLHFWRKYIIAIILMYSHFQTFNIKKFDVRSPLIWPIL